MIHSVFSVLFCSVSRAVYFARLLFRVRFCTQNTAAMATTTRTEITLTQARKPLPHFARTAVKNDRLARATYNSFKQQRGGLLFVLLLLPPTRLFSLRTRAGVKKKRFYSRKKSEGVSKSDPLFPPLPSLLLRPLHEHAYEPAYEHAYSPPLRALDPHLAIGTLLPLLCIVKMHCRNVSTRVFLFIRSYSFSPSPFPLPPFSTPAVDEHPIFRWFSMKR